MKLTFILRGPILGYMLLLSVIFFSTCSAPDWQTYTKWQIYRGDAGSTGYSSLDQINRENVDQLKVAWIFDPQDADGARVPKYECNPIIIGDRLFATSARHWVYALDAGTGKMIWSYNPRDGDMGVGIKRGVTYWEKGDDRRILLTAGEYLYALNADSGKPINDFGERGRVRLDTGLGPDPDSVWVIPTSPGIVFEDLLILGSEVSELYDAAPGHVRAFNILTGELAWTFHTIPQPGETGYDTWPEDAWKSVGGANNWGGMSLDQQRGMVFVPLGSPSYDYYGLNRIGMNLFGNCVVALEAATGKLVWYFQTVHHDLWDYDLPAPPTLITIEQDGKKIDALAQTTKSGFLFVLDRETGEPVFPVEERPVPASRIPGEQAWPTQPIPLKPAPYARQKMSESDLTAFSPEDHQFLLRRFREVRYEGLYTPPDSLGTLMVPGSRGGSEWGGSAFDPETGVIYLNSNESPEIASMISARKQQSKNQGGSAYKRGNRFYTNYCATCHGSELEGFEPNIPSLQGLKGRMTKEEVLGRIANGGNKMPAFGPLLEGFEDEIIAFLFDLKEQATTKQAVKKDAGPGGYVNTTAYSFFRDGSGRPGIKPPWGTLNAIDLNTGDYLWKIPLGNHPEWQQPGEGATGSENYGGAAVTAGGLVFIGATRDKKFRAFDKDTGALLWEDSLPAGAYATPAIYEIDGIQLVAIAVSSSDENPSGHLRAYALIEDSGQ